MVGTVWLIPAFLIYLGIVWELKNLVIEDEEVYEEEPSGNVVRFTGSASAGFCISVVLLSLSAAVLQLGVHYLNVYLHKNPVYPRQNFSVLPSQLDDWRRDGDDVRLDAAGVEALGTELYLNRAYHSKDNSLPPILLHIAYYTGQVDAVPHVPDRCMVAGGYSPATPEPITLPININQSSWEDDPEHRIDVIPYRTFRRWNKQTEQEETIRMPFGEFELRITEFSNPKLGDDRVFAGYFFIANGKTTAYPERIRLLAFDRSSKYAYYCKVQFLMRGRYDFTTEQFVEAISDFTTNMLPSIMECLPDWSEVTSTTTQLIPQENQDL